ncbi:mucin-2-like [Hemiscyllium ocellatum]|uniref:mucin-2-like n=1 Tax=Hemiscyllium ocellatum TaxID=170820 RepID=UPI002967684B|nr:mucin-2-like [Hemiscyllium ocellatum]
MRMETVDRWRICLCLFVTVFTSSRGNHHPTSPGDSITAMPRDTPAFNLNSTVMGIINYTASTADTINDTVTQADIGSTMAFTSITPSLKSETSFNDSLEKSTVSMLTTAPNISNLTQKSGLANDTSSDLQRSVNNSSPIPKSVSPSVSSVVTESNGNDAEGSSTVKITAIPKQTETSVKVSSTYKDSTLTVKSTGMSYTSSAGQKESKDATSSFPTEPSPVSTTLPMQPTSKTRLTSMTTSRSVMPSTVIMPLSTSHTSPTTTTTTTTTATTVRATARRGTTINIATTSFSVQHIEGNLANTKEMVNGRPVSNPNGTRMDPLVIGLTTVFFIIIGIVSILGFLKYRQRNNQPEFRRLHELPMDDMMEEDTPLSLYSY